MNITSKFAKPKHTYSSISNQLNNILINNGTFKGFNYDIAKTIFPFLQINTSSFNTNTMFSFKNFFLNYMFNNEQDQIQVVYKENITGSLIKTSGIIKGLDCYTQIEVDSNFSIFNFTVKQTLPTSSSPIYAFNALTNLCGLNFGIEIIKQENIFKKGFLIEHKSKSFSQILQYQTEGYKYGIIKQIDRVEIGMEWHLFSKFIYGAIGFKINTLKGWVKTELNSMLRLAVLIEQKLLENLIFTLCFESDKFKNVEIGMAISFEF
ncbi:hypothetical protein CDIK_0490 [Cucumispora dikerogammari]|nr:hypothetical protein CDIK_0490 [Cucumispora dikerogammari]